MTVLFGNPVQVVSQRIDFTRHGYLHDQLLILVDGSCEVYLMLYEARVKCFKSLGIRGVHEQAVYLIGKIIPGGTENQPVIRQFFGFEEYFFSDDVERLVGGGYGNDPFKSFHSRRPGFLLSIARFIGNAVQANETA